MKIEGHVRGDRKQDRPYGSGRQVRNAPPGGNPDMARLRLD